MTRKPLVRTRARATGKAFSRALLIGAVPAGLLVVYVLFWALAIRGGYYRAQLQSQIREARIERSTLEAEQRRLQSPGLILDRAGRELQMQPAEHREFAELPTTQRVARGAAPQTTVAR